MKTDAHFFSAYRRPQSRLASAADCYQVSQFLFAEADLLDSWLFDEWLQLLSPDIRYWSPARKNRLMKDLEKEVSPAGGSAHFEENFEMLRQRVARIDTNKAWAETPPSRSRHLISNIRVFHDAAGRADIYEADCCFQVYRSSGERSQDSVFGRRIDIVQRDPGEHGFKLLERTVVFDMATILVKNLSLIY